ncbi:MAG: glycosyltransferase, partial [Solirubrobacterales bacterium]|nr:glycosyltransferase [Solirubrobacterales bacterium]
MRALIVTNMWPSPEQPALGAFVRDQVDALRRQNGVEVEVFAFPPGGYARAAREIRRLHRGEDYDVVHAHFGLSAWVALALGGAAPRALTLHGTDVRHPRSRRITAAALGRMALIAAVSEELAAAVPGGYDVRVLPCGVDTQRFRPIGRREAREELGLPPEEPCLLFPADPARPGKRHDRAMDVADGARLLSLGGVDPARVPLWVNAANAVVLPTEAEGFGLAALEALACDVPVLTTPVGVHAAALAGIGGTLCAPFDRDRWRALAHAHLAAADPRVTGRQSAERWSADRMAAAVVDAWRE